MTAIWKQGDEVADLKSRLAAVEAEMDEARRQRDEGGHTECPHKKARMAAEAALARAREVLREVEWIWIEDEYGCLRCGSYKVEGHLPDCALKAALEGET